MWSVAYLNSVTGTLSPDATCNYIATGWYFDHPYLRRVDGAYHIWFDPLTPGWYLTVALGDLGTAFWERLDTNPYGIYLPKGVATGNATLQQGSHP